MIRHIYGKAFLVLCIVFGTSFSDLLRANQAIAQSDSQENLEHLSFFSEDISLNVPEGLVNKTFRIEIKETSLVEKTLPILPEGINVTFDTYLTESQKHEIGAANNWTFTQFLDDSSVELPFVNSDSITDDAVFYTANQLNQITKIEPAIPNVNAQSLSNQSQLDEETPVDKECYRAQGERENIELDCPGIEAGFKYESLNNNFDDWYEAFLVGETWITPGRSIFFSKFRQTDRFRLDDSEISLGAVVILDQNNRWAATLETTVSPSHNVLPEWSIKGKLKHAFTPDFLGEISFLHTEFTNAEFNQQEIRLEKIFGQFQLAYTLGLTQVLTAGDSSNHILEAKYYYTYGSNVAIRFFIGQIIEDLPDFDIRNDVVAGILEGKHLFNPHWGITYNFVVWDFGEQYTKVSGGLGIRYEF